MSAPDNRTLDLIDQIDALGDHIDRIRVLSFALEHATSGSGADGVVIEALTMLREQIDAARAVAWK